MDVLVLIDKLDHLVHNAKAVPLTDQVRVDREEIYDILDQMRATSPRRSSRRAGSSRNARTCWPSRSVRPSASWAKRVSRQCAKPRRPEIVKLAERQAQENATTRTSGSADPSGDQDWADEILATLEANLDKFLVAVRRGRERLHERSQESVVATFSDESLH